MHKNIAQIFRNYIIGRMCKIMEVLVVLITLAVITVVGILIFLGVRAIFEFFEEHSVARFILIGLVIVSLASALEPVVLIVVGGILLIKVLYIVGDVISDYLPDSHSHSYVDPGVCVYPKPNKEDDEIVDFDTYEDMFGNKYRYDRRYGELIDKNHQRIKVSQVYEHDLKLEDSKGYPYDRIN